MLLPAKTLHLKLMLRGRSLTWLTDIPLKCSSPMTSLKTEMSSKGCVVTIDAMGCQTDIAEKIVQEDGGYVLALKKNQDHLYEEVELLFDERLSK